MQNAALAELAGTIQGEGQKRGNRGYGVLAPDTFLHVNKGRWPTCPNHPRPSRQGTAKGPSSDGDGDGAILVPLAIPINLRNALRDHGRTGAGTPGTGIGEAGEPSNTLGVGALEAVAYAATDYQSGAFGEVEAARGLTTSADRTRSAPIAIQPGMAVRRLTPRECERLQGFPDDYTAITHRGKAAADGPRYRALGNSMAVPCMAWIGRRIWLAESILAREER